MVKKYQITSFERLKEKPARPVTKFGGQPDWLEEPQWPVSEEYEDRLMSFMGQIVLDKGMLGNDKDIIAYIFLTHSKDAQDSMDCDPIELANWGNRESAIIIQPGGEITCETKNVKEGPCMFDEDGNHYEYIPALAEGYDPDYINPDVLWEMEKPEQDKYIDQICGSKIGGVPSFFMCDEWPGDEWPEGDWKFLLQMIASELPFVMEPIEIHRLHFFVFISSDFKQGGLFVDFCS